MENKGLLIPGSYNTRNAEVNVFSALHFVSFSNPLGFQVGFAAHYHGHY